MAESESKLTDERDVGLTHSGHGSMDTGVAADSRSHPVDPNVPSARAAAETRRRTGRDPSLPPNHPINALSPTRKMLMLVSLGYAGFLCNASIAIANVAFPLVAETLHVEPGDIGNALGYNLLGCAVGSLIWNPLSRCIGRRPVYLFGSFLFMPVCVWQALSNTYGCFVAGRVFAGIVTAWSQTVPPASISDVYVKEVLGSRMSVYTVPSVIGPVIIPIFAAAIVRQHSWRNLWHFNLGLAGLQFLLVFFFCPETLWVPDHGDDAANASLVERDAVTEDKAAVSHVEDHDHVHHVGDVHDHPQSGHVGAIFWPHKDWKRFWPLMASPIRMFGYLAIALPSFYYGMCLGFLSVGVTVAFPQIFGAPPWNFGVVILGVCYLAFGIGGLLGLWTGGHLSDMVVWFREHKLHRHRQPEDRLWAGYPLFPLMFLGLLLCGLGVQLHLHWMCFLMGGAITFFALSGITTVIVTYTLETYVSRGMDTQAVFNFWKYIWGFAVPFFIMQWGERKEGWIVCYVGQGIILLVGGALVTTLLIWKGYEIRKAQGMPMVIRGSNEGTF